MEKMFLLPLVLLSLSLNAMDSNSAQGAQNAQLAGYFYCTYCKQNKSNSKEVDLKQHLAKVHKRCGICERLFDNLMQIRFHEAEHFTANDIKEQ